MQVDIHRLLPVARLLAACLLIQLCLPAHGQQNMTPAALLQAKDYTGYLAQTKRLLSASPASLPNQLPMLVDTAIALEKTGQWEGEYGKQARKLVGNSPDALRYFEAFHLALAGDIGSLEKIFTGKPPQINLWNQCIPALREHNFPVIADAFAVFDEAERTSSHPREGVIAWLRIPDKQRNTFDNVMDKVFQRRRLARRNFAMEALNLYLNPPPAGAWDYFVNDFYRLFLRLGAKQALLSVQTAQTLWQAEKRVEAIEVARKSAALNSTDPDAQYSAAIFLETLKERDAGIEVMEQGLKTVPAPQTHALHLYYCRYLKRAGYDDRLVKATGGTDPLLAGDVLAFQGEAAEAKVKYDLILADKNLPLPRRLAAWSGLLMVDPDSALQYGMELLDELAEMNAIQRAPLLRWYGQQLSVDLLPELSGRRDAPYQMQDLRLPDLHAVPHGKERLAMLCDRLLAIDTPALLQPVRDEYPYQSLAIPLAAFFAAAGQPQRAMVVLQRRIDYTEYPPQAGWLTLPAGINDPDQPVRRKGVNPVGLDDGLVATLFLLSGNPENDMASLNFAALSTQSLGERMKLAQDDGLDPRMKHLADAIRYTAQVSNRSSASTKVWQPVTTGVRQALAGWREAKASVTLIRDGLRPALIETKGQPTREAIYTLLASVLSRYREATSRTLAAGEAEYLAKVLDAIQDPALQAFARRLREQFPSVQR